MVQASTLGLSDFHATVILCLSWINNTNTFIYFLLYVQHKSQPGRGHIEMDWASWMEHVQDMLAALILVKVKIAHNNNMFLISSSADPCSRGCGDRGLRH
jgi:hypothetical protein